MHRAAAEKERLGDLGIRHSPRHQAQDLDLARRQVFEAGWGFCVELIQLRAG